MNKNVLIISYAYPPNNVAGAQRAFALAKYLDKSKYNIRVITCENPDLPLGKDESFDSTLENVECIYIRSLIRGSVINSVRVKENPQEEKAWGIVRVLKDRLFRFGQKLIFPDKGMFWFPKVKSFLKEHPEVIKEVDIVVSTSPGMTNHQIAFYIKKHKPSVKWIADFRDFNYVNHWEKKQGVRAAMHKKLEYSLLQAADNLTFVTQTMLEKYKSFYPSFTKKMHVIYNGFDVTEVTNEKMNVGGKIVFFYAGTFYNGIRSPIPLLLLLDRAIEEGLLEIKDVELRIAGNIGLDIIENMKGYVSFKCIVLLGNLPREKVLLKMQEASFLWLIVGNISSHYETVPIKLFEYIAARRPIINFAPSISEASQIIERKNLGVNFNTLPFDLEQSYCKFKDIIIGYKNGKYREPMPCENLLSFSWASQIALFEKIF